ncbi:MAG TPA: serine/threonine protein phosphatase, partial [Candidatus Bathyarchaeota archaeon]|nr:serine/threonine protein phosphatase [Candidatus Bathyarchaeota archaeon]
MANSHTDELVEEAMRARGDDLAELAERVASILASEEGHVGAAEVVGRLIKLPSSGKAIVVGDIHGDLASLQHILRETQFIKRVEGGEELWLVFLGDYGDRGQRSPEVYYVVLKLKELFPSHVVLLRGNHEGPPDILAVPHDLPYYLMAKFGRDEGLRAYKELR